MTPERITVTLDRVEQTVGEVFTSAGLQVTALKDSISDHLIMVREETSLSLSLTEVRIIKEITILTCDAEFHLLRAYYHASPSLWLIIVAIYGFIQTVVQVVTFINSILQVITGETLLYWLNKIQPGFEATWNNFMNRISEFSAALGWGVDGISHLMNIANVGTNMWGAVTGKTSAWNKTKQFERTQLYIDSLAGNLGGWQKNPGEMISKLVSRETDSAHGWVSGFMNNLIDKTGGALTKIETVTKGLGSISNEFLSMRNDMPDFIAKHIPQVIWDSLERTDSMINDRLLPRLDEFSSKIDEIDNLLDKYSKKTAELSERIAHPGDMLAEINNLPDYLRSDQLSKIDSMTSLLMKEQNQAEYIMIEGKLNEFAMLAEAATHPPAPVEFMMIELPGRSPGIVSEPRETWMAGDY